MMQRFCNCHFWCKNALFFIDKYSVLGSMKMFFFHDVTGALTHKKEKQILVYETITKTNEIFA